MRHIFSAGNLRWVACTYVGPHVISFLQSDNSNDLSALQNLLKESDDRVLYGVFSAKISGIVRWVFFTFIGDGVLGMNRAKVSMHKSGISNFFKGIACSISLSEPGDLEEGNLSAQLSSSGGFVKNSIKVLFSSDSGRVGVDLTEGDDSRMQEGAFVDDLQLLSFPLKVDPLGSFLNGSNESKEKSNLYEDFILWSNIADMAPLSLHGEGASASSSGAQTKEAKRNACDGEDLQLGEKDNKDDQGSLPPCLQAYVSFTSPFSSRAPSESSSTTPQ